MAIFLVFCFLFPRGSYRYRAVFFVCVRKFFAFYLLLFQSAMMRRVHRGVRRLTFAMVWGLLGPVSNFDGFIRSARPMEGGGGVVVWGSRRLTAPEDPALSSPAHPRNGASAAFGRGRTQG